MNSQEFRALHEAYMDVYNELDEGAEGGRFEYNQRHGRPLITPEISQRASSQETLGGGTYERGPKRLPKSKRKYDRQVLSGVRAASEQEKQRARKRLGIKEDIYDIIFSHLLDEGYAETPEAAEAIMVNMSEDWRESIVEEVLDEELTGARYKRAMEKAGGREALGKIPMTLAARVAVGREGQPLEVARKDPRNSVRTTTKGPTKRGGSGFKRRTKSDFQGVDDTVGSGNKAARRAGKKVKDTSDDL